MAEEGFKRKLAAILSADVEGYSRLMGDNEEATIRTLTTYRNAMTDLIQKYRGRVVDATGDNLLAEFVSVVDAVNCAVEIQRELAERNADLPYERKMEFRIGVNLGDVVEEEGRIYGDGVNIAARVESLAEAGGICISGRAYDHVENKLGLEYENLGEHEVKNIARPIRVYRVLSFPGAAAHRVVQAKEAVGKRWRKLALSAAVVVVVGVIAFVVWNSYFRLPSIEPASLDKMAFPLPEKPSIAVLPFVNMTGDPEQEYIGDGFSENIITAISHMPNLFVIARNSTFTYKGKSVKVQKISEDLGVRYVLEGSVQKSGKRIRVTAQLIDAIKGHHLWAEKYDREIKDFFDLLDEITLKIATSLHVKLTAGDEAQYYGCTGNLEAWGYMIKADNHLNRTTKEDTTKARKLSEQALKLDSKYVCALVITAWSHLLEARFGWSESRTESMKHAFEFTQKALALDDAQSSAQLLLGKLYFFKRQHDKSIAEIEKAIALNPNYADAFAHLGQTLYYAGDPDRAIAMIKKAMRLQPHYPPYFLHSLAGSYLGVGRFEEAIVVGKRLLELSQKGKYNPILPHILLAELYTNVDQEDKARIHAAEVLKFNPKFSLNAWQKIHFYKNPADLERRLVALRKAGLPDKPPLPLPDKPSIAVLPFTNMSGDPEQEYFSDGMTDDLITDLSKVSGILVISRNSTFAYKGKSVDIPQIAKKLGVRYVLEGSVRKVDEQVRINAQLIDAETGHHLWAERYDGKLGDVFSLQDKIVKKIVVALAVNLTDDEQEHITSKETNSTEAYNAFLKGSDSFSRYDPELIVKGLSYFKDAIELDPNYWRAYAALGEAYFKVSNMGFFVLDKLLDISFMEARLRARHYLQMAMKQPTSIAYRLASVLFSAHYQYEEAITTAEHAVFLEPNNPRSNNLLAFALSVGGRPKEGSYFSKKAYKCDPGCFW